MERYFHLCGQAVEYHGLPLRASGTKSFTASLLLGTRASLCVTLQCSQTFAPVFSLAFCLLSSHSTVFPVLSTSLLPIGYDPSDASVATISDDLTAYRIGY
jgi:hypothetical protein